MNNQLNGFDESRPEFIGFNAFYAKTISPYLESLEQERVAAVKNANVKGLAASAFVFALAAFVYSKTGSIPFFIGISVVALLLGFGTRHIIAHKISGEIKQFIMDNVCGFVGLDYACDNFSAPDLEIWRTNKLLPGYDRVNFEDQMSGTAHGAGFIFCEAHLETKHRDKDGNTTWSTSFRGILLTINCPHKFLGRTVVLRDAGWFNAKKKSGMKRVGLVDPVFEDIFEAYSTDQVEARYLLTPDFMQRLVDLETTISGKRIRFGFLQRQLYIAIEAPDQFEIGSMFKTLLGTERTQKILDEIGAIYNVIDGVMKPLKKTR